MNDAYDEHFLTLNSVDNTIRMEKQLTVGTTAGKTFANFLKTGRQPNETAYLFFNESYDSILKIAIKIL